MQGVSGKQHRIKFFTVVAHLIAEKLGQLKESCKKHLNQIIPPENDLDHSLDNVYHDMVHKLCNVRI